MKHFTLVLVFALGLSNAFADACLTTQPEGESFCIEYKSDNSDVMKAMKRACDASPTSQWVRDCEGAVLGCRQDKVFLVTTIWFMNNETRDEVEQACQLMNGELVTRD